MQHLAAEISSGWWVALFQVILIDLTLAADNAVVIGIAAAQLDGANRKKAIAIGILAATAIRVIFAIFAVELLEIVGLILVGGLLLLYVAWKMWHDLRAPAEMVNMNDTTTVEKMSFGRAVTTIIIADISMSLDNVLAVAGAAREHMDVLVIGLVLSITFMGVASTAIAKLLHKYHWIAYIGLIMVLYIALTMIYEGSAEVFFGHSVH